MPEWHPQLKTCIFMKLTWMVVSAWFQVQLLCRAKEVDKSLLWNLFPVKCIKKGKVLKAADSMLSFLFKLNNSKDKTFHSLCDLCIFNHTSSVAVSPVCWPTTLVWTEISQQLLDRLLWGLVQTFMSPSGSILLTLLVFDFLSSTNIRSKIETVQYFMT